MYIRLIFVNESCLYIYDDLCFSHSVNKTTVFFFNCNEYGTIRNLTSVTIRPGEQRTEINVIGLTAGTVIIGLNATEVPAE